MTQLALTLLILLPLLAALVDGTAGIRARGYTVPVSTLHVTTFRILVPIWGRIEYLQNVQYLRQYGNRVTLCTTGDESPEFYEGLRRIAEENGFQLFIDKPKSRAASVAHHKRLRQRKHKRATSGTIRDRVIRNALQTVTEPYVIPIDADTTTVEPLSILVGTLVERNLDIASIRLILSNPKQSLLTRLQRFEYRLAMQIRFVAPWMVSGACHVAKTPVLRDVMNRHSLFFQGNDVETGVIAHARGYRVGHIPFEVLTEAPARLKPWWRQRLAWAGGEFRLFIVNAQLVFKHPFFWIYGGAIGIVGFTFRWISLVNVNYGLIAALAAYLLLVLYLHWKTRNGWMLLMPIYTLVSSLIMTPLGVIWYFKMAISGRNWGLIRPNRAEPA